MPSSDHDRCHEAVIRWYDSAFNDYKIALDLIKLKHYHYGLFLCHLTIEKLLKGLIVQSGKEILLIHDLVRLTEMANLKLSKKYIEWLEEITKFHIAGRYAEIKLEFYQKSTLEYTNRWLKNTKGLIEWLKKKYN